MEIKQYTSEQQIGKIKNQKEIENNLQTNANRNTTNENLWYAAKQFLEESLSHTHKKNSLKKKISNKQPNLPPQGTRKKEQTEPKVSRRNKIKIKAKININRKIIEKINETKSWFSEETKLTNP